MVESPRREYYAIEPEFAGNTGGGDADARQRQAFKMRGHPGTGANKKEQFVFFTAMQRLLSGRSRETRRHDDIRGDARCQTNAFEIEGQAIADIDCRRGSQFFAQEMSEGEPGFGIQMALRGLCLLRRSAPGHSRLTAPET